jgi:hypothetical protein
VRVTYLRGNCKPRFERVNCDVAFLYPAFDQIKSIFMRCTAEDYRKVRQVAKIEVLDEVLSVQVSSYHDLGARRSQSN